MSQKSNPKYSLGCNAISLNIDSLNNTLHFTILCILYKKLLWLRTIKKHLKHCNYDSVTKFGMEGSAVVHHFTIIMQGQRTVRVFYDRSLNRVR